MLVGIFRRFASWHQTTPRLGIHQAGHRRNASSMRTIRTMPGTREWLVPLSSVFALSAVVTLAAVSFGPGCQTRCFNDFECADGEFCSSEGLCRVQCYSDFDCRRPPECQN